MDKRVMEEILMHECGEARGGAELSAEECIESQVEAGATNGEFGAELAAEDAAEFGAELVAEFGADLVGSGELGQRAWAENGESVHSGTCDYTMIAPFNQTEQVDSLVDYSGS